MVVERSEGVGCRLLSMTFLSILLFCSSSLSSFQISMSCSSKSLTFSSS